MSAAATRTCVFCGKTVDPGDRYVWRRVIGWERKAIAVSRKSGSDIVLREPRDEYACDVCINRQQQGLNVLQEQLL